MFIIFEAISDHQKGKGTAIQRALVGMSVVDVLASFAWGLSTWAVPEGTAPLGRGNVASCNFQGFLLQFAIGAPLYNCSLSLYYVLVIRYNWTNARLAKIERFVHAFIITFTLGTSIAGLPLTMYNQLGNVCWVMGSPKECGNSSASPSDIPCDRGDWAWVFGISLFYGPLWVCVLLTVIAMFMIYLHLRRIFRRNQRYVFSVRDTPDPIDERRASGWGSTASRVSIVSIFRPSTMTKTSTQGGQVPTESEISGGVGFRDSWLSALGRSTRFQRSDERERRRQRNKQSLFATQAILYSLSFFITWAPSTIWSVARWLNAGGFGLDLAAAICEPLQGFMNMLIFIRRRKSSQEKLRRLFCVCRCICIRMFPLREFSNTESMSETGSDVRNASRHGQPSMVRDSIMPDPSESEQEQKPGLVDTEKAAPSLADSVKESVAAHHTEDWR
jgi:hypothetical protein